MGLKIKRYEEKFKILILFVLLSILFFFTYYFLFILKISTIFTHFFYIPIILACLWWKKKGLVITIFIAGFLIFSSLFLESNEIIIDNLLRSLIQILIGIITTILSEQISKVEEKLKESEGRYRDFISVASHEFKTPLIPIIGIPQLILKDKNLTEQQKDFINEILLSGKKLNKLMDNLLDTTKIDAKIIELTKREIEINPLINRCISDLAFLMKHNNHTVIKRLKENVKLNIDDKKISRVLTNLILNAIKYTPQNGKIEISTQIDAADNFIFSIKDNGIGIDKKDADLVFQKFGKIRKVEMSQYNLDTYGTGLGLYISKEIIKLHGGEIWFESEGRNKGTTFNFKLPIKDN